MEGITRPGDVPAIAIGGVQSTVAGNERPSNLGGASKAVSATPSEMSGARPDGAYSLEVQQQSSKYFHPDYAHSEHTPGHSQVESASTNSKGSFTYTGNPRDPEQGSAIDKSFVPRGRSPWALGIAATLLLCAGSYDTIIAKWMNRQSLPPCSGCKEKLFTAPFFQTLLMYLGEAICLLVYHADKVISRSRNRPQTLEIPASAKSYTKPKCPVYFWLVPTLFDFVSSTMINYANLYCQASTTQLLRNFNVVVTAILTVAYIRVALRVHQVTGVLVVTLGLVLTGIDAMIHPETTTNYSGQQWIGILMAVFGTMISSFQFVFEEKLFRKYRVSPLEGVGLEGVYGTAITIIALIILQVTGAEKTSETFYMLGQHRTESTILIVALITYIPAITVFNASGLMITKLGSGLLRTVLVALRTLSIWVIELIIQWNYFVALNFVGLLVILGGVLLYNYSYFLNETQNSCDQLLRKPLPCCGSDIKGAPIETDVSMLSRSASIMAVQRRDEYDDDET